MVINFLSGGSFRVQSGEVSLLVDPESARYKADVTLRTLTSIDQLKPGDGSADQNEIYFPGEYEIKEIEIFGTPVPEESSGKFLKTMYALSWEGVKLAFLGHLSRPPSAEIIDKLNEPDIIFLPVGGGHFLTPEAAAKLAKQLEPAFVIPAFYKNPADFLKLMGQKAEVQEKLVFKKKDLVNEKMRVVLLGPKS